MKKKVLGLLLAAGCLLGNSMMVCAEETPPADAPGPAPVQNYQQIMTPEILASFQGVTLESDISILGNALVRRTDVWGTLQDADGDGIDDRDPINGCGYLDLNCNGFDDRFEMELLNSTMQADPGEGYALQLTLNVLFGHRCKHGIIASSFIMDEDVGIVSLPDYYELCPECTNEMREMMKAIDNMMGGVNLL